MKKNLSDLLTTLSIVAAVFVFTASTYAKPLHIVALGVSGVEILPQYEQKAFKILNKIRSEKGLRKLAWSEDLAKVARLHSVNMAKFQFFSHRGKDGTIVSDRAESFGIKWDAIGENIGYNRGYQNPVEKVCDGWMGSAGHRRNILDQVWKEAALGVALAEDGGVYFTMVFIAR